MAPGANDAVTPTGSASVGGSPFTARSMSTGTVDRFAPASVTSAESPGSSVTTCGSTSRSHRGSPMKISRVAASFPVYWEMVGSTAT